MENIGNINDGQKLICHVAMSVKSDLKHITSKKKSNANSQFLVDPSWDSLLIDGALGESMVKYIKKFDEKIQVKKETTFHGNTRKQIQILFNFHFETIELSIEFIVNQLESF